MINDRKQKIVFGLVAFLILLLLMVYFLTVKGRFSFSTKNNMAETMDKKENKLTLKSSSFKDGEFIPKKFTGEGENVNPFLEIKNVPENTKSLALIVDDPDATGGVTWVHWVLWNINPKTQYIPEDSVPEGAVVGVNSWGKNSYGGPYPPVGSKPHRYMFKLYALDVVLDLEANASANDLEKAMEGHILEKTVLMGLYKR